MYKKLVDEIRQFLLLKKGGIPKYFHGIKNEFVLPKAIFGLLDTYKKNDDYGCIEKKK